MRKKLRSHVETPVPEEVKNGVRIKMRDLASYFDEADYAIPQHVHSLLTDEGKKSVKVLSSDIRSVMSLSLTILER